MDIIFTPLAILVVSLMGLGIAQDAQADKSPPTVVVTRDINKRPPAEDKPAPAQPSVALISVADNSKPSTDQ